MQAQVASCGQAPPATTSRSRDAGCLVPLQALPSAYPRPRMAQVAWTSSAVAWAPSPNPLVPPSAYFRQCRALGSMPWTNASAPNLSPQIPLSECHRPGWVLLSACPRQGRSLDVSALAPRPKVRAAPRRSHLWGPPRHRRRGLRRQTLSHQAVARLTLPRLSPSPHHLAAATALGHPRLSPFRRLCLGNSHAPHSVNLPVLADCLLVASFQRGSTGHQVGLRGRASRWATQTRPALGRHIKPRMLLVKRLPPGRA